MSEPYTADADLWSRVSNIKSQKTILLSMSPVLLDLYPRHHRLSQISAFTAISQKHVASKKLNIMSFDQSQPNRINFRRNRGKSGEVHQPPAGELELLQAIVGNLPIMRQNYSQIYELPNGAEAELLHR